MPKKRVLRIKPRFVHEGPSRTGFDGLSGYIPTNVISITDGQIYLESDLFHQGIRPAIDVGNSVSRVGGAAQVTAMRQVAGTLRLDLAQYRELAGFAQFGSDLDQATRAQLDRGERLVEVLKQRQYEPLPIEKQIVMLYAGTRGFLDRHAVADIGSYERELYGFVETRHSAILATLTERNQIDDRLTVTLDGALREFATVFQQTRQLAAAA